MKEPSLIIIGAGAAGLMAAKELNDDFQITILEARSHVGGRIRDVLVKDNLVNAGAEFVHGKLDVTLKLLKKAGIKYAAVTGKMFRNKHGKLQEEEDMMEGWDEMLRKMKKVKQDMTMLRFLETFYPGAKNDAFRKHVAAFTEGFDIADPGKVSMKSLYNEWSQGNEENYRIEGGYSRLMEWMNRQKGKKSHQLITNKIVNEIHWSDNNVSVYTQDGAEYTADKLLITVPVSILAQDPPHIRFIPAVEDQVDAMRSLGFGQVIKIIIFFKKLLWPSDAAFLFSDETFFPTWWTQLPLEKAVLTGWCGGPKAGSIANEPEDAILEKALASLSAVLGVTVNELTDNIEEHKIYNWQHDLFSLGGYSYETLQSGISKKKLRSHLLNTIFFAGEGLYSGDHPGTVEAALVSGKLAAKAIKKMITIRD